MDETTESEHLSTIRWVLGDVGDKDVDKLVNHPQIQEAACWVQRGEVVAFPTETVYGLGANALRDQATQKIFEAKGRPSDNPLIVHIADLDQLRQVVDNFPDQAQRLAAAFWPGPLTMVLPKNKNVCHTVTAGLSTVAVRLPDHPLARALIRAAALPLAAPSANRSGRPSPTLADHVLEDLSGKIVGVLDGGQAGVGLESTVVDLTTERPTILRPGGVTKEMLERIVGTVDVDPALLHNRNAQPKSPGLKYKHYAPRGDMWLVDRSQGEERMRTLIQQAVDRSRQQGLRVGVITCDDGVNAYEADHVLTLGPCADMHMIARNIYRVLRKMDELGVEKIYAETFPAGGLAEAVMNRLMKAANGQIIERGMR